MDDAQSHWNTSGYSHANGPNGVANKAIVHVVQWIQEARGDDEPLHVTGQEPRDTQALVDGVVKVVDIQQICPPPIPTALRISIEVVPEGSISNHGKEFGIPSRHQGQWDGKSIINTCYLHMFRYIIELSPDITMNVEQENVESLLLHLEKGEVRDQKSTQKEEGVHRGQSIHDDLVPEALISTQE